MRIGILTFCILCWISPILYGQQAAQPKDPTETKVSPAATPVENSMTVESIDAKRKEIATRIETVKKNLEAVTENTPQEIRDKQVQIQQQLERIDSVLNQQIGVLKQSNSYNATITQSQSQLEQLRTNGPTEKSPYSYILLDNLRNQLSAEEGKGPTLDEGIKVAQDGLDQARKMAEDQENTRRLAKESMDKNGDPAAIPLVSVRYRVVQLDTEMAQETVNLRKMELESLKAGKVAYEAQLAFLQERIKWIEKDAVFLEKDLQEQFQVLDNDKTQLSSDLKKSQDNLNLAQKSLETSQDRLAKETDQTPLLIEEERARRFERDYYQEEVYIIPKRLARIEDRRQVWQHRYDLVNRKSSMQMQDTWVTESSNRINVLESDKNLQSSLMASIRKDLSSLSEKIDQVKDDKNVLVKLQQQQTFLQKRIALVADNINRIESLQRFYSKLIEEVKQSRQTWSLTETFQYLQLQVEKFFDRAVWSSGTKEKENEEYILTIGNIVVALTYLIVGIFLARLISRRGIRMVLSRLHVHDGATAALQALSYYFFLIIVVLLTLDAISIPLTAFAFLGGALAIGVGFGSQNILNNFISGLILLVERPIRVGDLIEVDGVEGTVVSIGARCTRLQTFSNVDQLIPNSKFLESKVVNLTFEDCVIRTTLTVGAAYGSDVREILRLVKKAVDEHGLINKHPDPFVVLADFGNDALIFEVRFWVTINRVNRLIVESDVRHRIYNLFRDAGIGIPFPQRDIHLDTAKPLEIRMARDEPPPPETA